MLGGLAQALPASAESASAGTSADPTDATSLEIVSDDTVEDRTTVTWQQELHWGQLWHRVEKRTCPDGTYLSPKQYYDSPRVPTGLEIFHGWNFDADIWPVFKDDNIFGEQIGVGAVPSTISTIAGPAQTVTFIMHCVR